MLLVVFLAMFVFSPWAKATVVTVTDNPQTIQDLSSGRDFDYQSNKSITIRWSFTEAKISKKYNSIVHVYIGVDGAPPSNYLGQSNQWSESLDYFTWVAGADNLDSVYKSGPEYGHKYTFRVYFLTSAGAPYPSFDSAGAVEFLPPLVVTTSTESSADVSNTTVKTETGDRRLVFKWNWVSLGINPADVYSTHVYVNVNNSVFTENGVNKLYYQYLTNNGGYSVSSPSNREFAVWTPNGNSVGKDFRNGPQFGVSYKFKVYVLLKNKTLGFEENYSNAGPVLLQEKEIFSNPTATKIPIPVPTATPVTLCPIHIEVKAPGINDAGVIYLEYNKNMQIEVHITHDELTGPILTVELFNNNNDPVNEFGTIDADVVDGKYREVHVYNLSGANPGTYDFGISVSDGAAKAEKLIRLIVGPKPMPTQTSTQTPKPAATQTRTPLPQVTVIVADNLSANDNLAGGIDYDAQFENELVIKWTSNMFASPQTVDVFVSINGGSPVALKQGINAADGSLRWYNGADVVLAYKSGPEFGRNYNFVVYFYQMGKEWDRVSTGIVQFKLQDPIWTPTPTITLTPINTPTQTYTPIPTSTFTATPTPGNLFIGLSVENSSTGEKVFGIIDNATTTIPKINIQVADVIIIQATAEVANGIISSATVSEDGITTSTDSDGKTAINRRSIKKYSIIGDHLIAWKVQDSTGRISCATLVVSVTTSSVSTTPMPTTPTTAFTPTPTVTPTPVKLAQGEFILTWVSFTSGRGEYVDANGNIVPSALDAAGARVTIPYFGSPWDIGIYKGIGLRAGEKIEAGKSYQLQVKVKSSVAGTMRVLAQENRGGQMINLTDSNDAFKIPQVSLKAGEQSISVDLLTISTNTVAPQITFWFGENASGTFELKDFKLFELK